MVSSGPGRASRRVLSIYPGRAAGARGKSRTRGRCPPAQGSRRCRWSCPSSFLTDIHLGESGHAGQKMRVRSPQIVDRNGEQRSRPERTAAIAAIAAPAAPASVGQVSAAGTAGARSSTAQTRYLRERGTRDRGTKRGFLSERRARSSLQTVASPRPARRSARPPDHTKRLGSALLVWTGICWTTGGRSPPLHGQPATKDLEGAPALGTVEENRGGPALSCSAPSLKALGGNWRSLRPARVVTRLLQGAAHREGTCSDQETRLAVPVKPVAARA